MRVVARRAPSLLDAAGGAMRLSGPLRTPHTQTTWWIEATVLVSLYFVYSAARGVADSSVADAIARGFDLQRFSAAAQIDVELGLNRWLQSVPVLAIACCYYYATAHFVVTPAVLFWMHRRHREHYGAARWTIALTTVITLAGFFAFPTAPPRLLPGSAYVDTMARFAGWGWWSSGSSAAPVGLEGLANHYAALPSLHCAWALWCGLLLIRRATSPMVRVLGGLYPFATAFVVTATANHYLIDVLAGWAVLGVSALAAGAIDVGRWALLAENSCGAARCVSASRPRFSA